jgi:DNA-binding beta-propeller fold protein YncE
MRANRTVIVFGVAVVVAALAGSTPAHAARAVPVGSGPEVVVIDAGTHTAYVTSDDGVLSVIDVRACNARQSAGCSHPVAAVAMGSGSGGVDLNRRTKTLYVSSGDEGTVSLIDAARCNAVNTSGCSGPLAVVTVGDIPQGIAVNTRTNTIYVGNIADRVSVIDGRACRRGDTSGCSATPASVAGAGPLIPVVDEATSTVYVPENGPGADGSGDSVLVVDARRCQATDTSGCATAMPEVLAESGPVTSLLNPATHTLYVANQNTNTISVVDVRHCNSMDTAGCVKEPTSVPGGLSPTGGFALDHQTQTLFVGNVDSDTLSVIDTGRCRAGRTSGCPTVPAPTLRTGHAPVWLAFDPDSDTVFSVDHGDNDLAAIDASRCNSVRTDGCRKLAPTFPAVINFEIVDPAQHTWYGFDASSEKLFLVDTRICNAAHPKRCASALSTTTHAEGEGSLAVNSATHTMYVHNLDAPTISMIDTRACNAHVTHPDCSEQSTRIAYPGSNANFAVNETTGTIYSLSQDPAEAFVIDGTTCNAAIHSSCSAPLGVIPFGTQMPFGITADPTTNTVYVSINGQDGDDQRGHTVAVFDDRHCRAGDITGCDQTPGVLGVGLEPTQLAVDPATHSLYVANLGDDSGGSVSVADTRQCRGSVHSRCDQVTTTVPVNRLPLVLSLDPVTHQVFTSDFLSATVSRIDATLCNASRTSGCRSHQIATGDLPADQTLDINTHTLFTIEGIYGNVAVIDSMR